MKMTIGRKRQTGGQIELKFAVRAKSRNSDNIGACLRFLSQVRLGKLAFSTKKEDQDEVALLQSRIDAILSNAAGQRGKIGRIRESATITPDTVATALPPGGLLMEFVQFSDPKIEGDAGRCYGALLLGRDGESKFLRIDDAAAIDASVRVLREAIARGDEKALVEQQKLLSEKLWIPIAKIIPEKTKNLFIGPDGQLNFLSFAALPASDGSFLAEHYDIAYVGSGRDLARKVSPSESKTIALFADPVFDRQASGFSTNALALRSGEVDALGKIVLPPLPGTKAEEAAVEEVAKAGGWTPDGRLGEAANKSAIMNLKSPGILHLATHGFYLNTPPSNGADGERGMKVIEAMEMSGNKPATLPKIDPMHASGIALTGAQATLKAWSEGRVPDPKDDGILTAEEVGGLNLDGTWLVTLSACETGVGEARSGEGVFGLRRAFMIAGAQNLLMTLWPVSDEVTPKIMTDFYKEALATHDAAGSLAKVQRDWLVKLRKEKGLLAAVRDAGPFAMVVMANPNLGKTTPTSQPVAQPSPAPKDLTPTAQPSPSSTPTQAVKEMPTLKKAA
jgi:CHAT domain-containing protein